MGTLAVTHVPGASTQDRPPITLTDRYTRDSGRALMSGIHALVRLMLEQRRLDARRGLDTGAFVSGYEGSPLGGLDQELARAREHLDPLNIVFRPGLNEELAATAVSGTQLLSQVPEHDHDGVVGYWYGKNPGLDRAADAIRHGGIAGTAPLGGAVALIGDDPAAKSSTLPSACEPLCRSLLMPLLAPSTVREIIVLGLHAVALSRESGLWSGLKIVTEIADGSATVDLAELATGVPAPSGRPAEPPRVLLAAGARAAEEDAMTARLERVHAYARRTGLNHIAFEPASPRVAIVAAGVAFTAVQTALEDLGLDDAGRRAAGVRLVKLGMPWPLDPVLTREQLAGVEQVLVVEDKLAFVESQIKEALYGTPGAPPVLGKRDAQGRSLLPERGTLSADEVTRAIGRVLGADALPPAGRERLRALDPAARGAGRAAAARAHAVLLLGLSAQRLHARRGRPARRRRDRLPRDDRPRRGPPRPHARHAADGRRGSAVARARAVRPRPALRAEPRRRHVPPLRLARDPRGDRRRRGHDLQAPLQRRRRDDGRAGAGRPDGRARDHPTAGDRGRAADHRDDRGPGVL